MFNRLSQPLDYAAALLQRLTGLAGNADRSSLCRSLTEATAELTGCPLSQLYLLDDTHTELLLSSEWHAGQWQGNNTRMPSDYSDLQLLQYCLCQNRELHLDNLDASLYPTPFLPDTDQRWHSLLCLPLHDSAGHVAGLLLLASPEPRDLHGFTESLRLLGQAVIAQLGLLQQLTPMAANATSLTDDDPHYRKGYGLIGDSPAMQQLYRLISKVLHNPVSVLLNGETGTGKELVARAIHDYGHRRSAAFVVQNCAALPEHLLESELFGYRKGAFSGADRDHAGLLDSAHGGTLFLDEIGDMPLTLQAKLLRVLQEGEIRPLGSTAIHVIDVRIIAATHRDLHQRVEQGLFREDLYYRLANFPITLPPLRERQSDIPLLARYFAAQASDFLQRPACRLATSSLDLLCAYRFPGNVRELKALVERAVLLSEGTELLPQHFNLTQLTASVGHLSLRERLENIERTMLLESLQRNQGNQTSAASELGLPRRTLLYRMQKLNISPAEHNFKEKANARVS
ncbi:MAG: sigma-54-dependent Fis family transcriptional regulator [Pseudomonadaceae bacterium]|nr:MAG: sigma-54-dependent Fis family transcriptional regulator [Pseudomonadaceae bacterium]